MSTREDEDRLTAILDRIASDTYTADDLHWLGQAARVRGDKNVVQFGRYNVRLERGNNIYVGDRIYMGVEADAIRSALQDVVQDAGRGWLRGFSGFVITVGMVIGLVGMAMVFYGVISAMGSNETSSGLPAVLLQGVAIAFVGVVTAIVGQLIRGWLRPRRR